MNCSSCGHQLENDTIFCPYCGERRIIQEKRTGVILPQTCNLNDINITEESDCSRIVFILLCFFLGGLGIHRFYSGRVLLGLLHILCIIAAIAIMALSGDHSLGVAGLAVNVIWIIGEFIIGICGLAQDNLGNVISRW